MLHRPQLLKRGEAFFQTHGVAAIVIARFTPGVRAIVPLITGISSMQPRRFALLDVVSALLWVPSHVVVGVVIGASLTVLGAIAGRLELLIAVVLLIGGLVLWSLPHLVRGTMLFLERQREPVLTWASWKDDWLRQQVRSLLDPTRRELSGLLALCATLLASLWLLLGVLQDMIAGDPLVVADHTILRLLTRLRMKWATQFAVAALAFGSGIVTIVVAIASLAWLCRIPIDLRCKQLLQAMRSHVLTLSRRSAREPVAVFIVEYLRHSAQGSANAILETVDEKPSGFATGGHRSRQVQLPISRADIADYLGVILETTSRCFAEFRRLGIIVSSSGGAIHVVNRARLEWLTGG